MASLLSSLGGLLGGLSTSGTNSSGGLLTQAFGPASPDPSLAFLGQYYDPNAARAAGFSNMIRNVTAAFGKGRGNTLSKLSDAAQALGPSYSEGKLGYLKQGYDYEQAANKQYLMDQQKQSDMGLADFIAAHPDLAPQLKALGPNEARKVLGDIFAYSQGVGRGQNTADVYGAGAYERIPNTDPNTNEKYPYVWQHRKPGLRGQEDTVTKLPVGTEPSGDPNLRADQAGAVAGAKTAAEWAKDKPQVRARTDMAVAQSEKMKTNIMALYKSPGLDQIVGPSGLITDPNVIRTFTPEAAHARNLYDSIISQYVSDTLTAMRNAAKSGGAFGNVTNYEDQILRDQAAIQRAMNPADMRAALTMLWQHTEQINQIIKNTYSDTYKEEFQPTPLPQAPAELQSTTGTGEEDPLNLFPKGK